LPYAAGYHLARRAAVDYENAVRLCSRERTILLAQLFMELQRFSLETIGAGFSSATLGARKPYFCRNVEDEREFGHRGSDRHALEASDQTLVNIAERALIDARGIDETIGDDPLAIFQCRQNGVAHMVVAGSREEYCLGFRSQWLGDAGQQNVANDL